MMDRGETVRLIVPKIFKIAFNLISTIFNYIYILCTKISTSNFTKVRNEMGSIALV